MLDFLVTFCCQSDPAKNVGPITSVPDPPNNRHHNLQSLKNGMVPK